MRRILFALGLAVLLVMPISKAASAAGTIINVSTASQLTRPWQTQLRDKQ